MGSERNSRGTRPAVITVHAPQFEQQKVSGDSSMLKRMTPSEEGAAAYRQLRTNTN